VKRRDNEYDDNCYDQLTIMIMAMMTMITTIDFKASEFCENARILTIQLAKWIIPKYLRYRMILIVILRDVNFSAFIGSSIVSFVFSFFFVFYEQVSVTSGLFGPSYVLCLVTCHFFFWQIKIRSYIDTCMYIVVSSSGSISIRAV